VTLGLASRGHGGRAGPVDRGGIRPGRYDAEGNRAAISSNSGNVKERFLHSGLGRSILADMDGEGRTKTRYVTLPGGQLLARVDASSNKPSYYHFDALGSSVAVTDEKGRVVSRSTYDPYGARRSRPTTDDRYGFVGNEWVKDEGNGLMEMGARFYESPVGRFLSVDPVAYDAIPGERSYMYCANNPVNSIDPSGLLDECYWCKIEAKVGCVLADLVNRACGGGGISTGECIKRECRNKCPADVGQGGGYT